MKAHHLAAFVLTASIAAPLSANISTGNISQDVQSALGSSGSVNVFVRDGVATLTGNVGDAQDRHRIRRAALAFDGIERVVDLTSSD